jgi:nitrogen fixation-related uncharacterized protein
MIYSFGWLTLVIISLAVSIAAFIWGAANGQFTEQVRARYLPLCDELPTEDTSRTPKHSPALYVLLGIIIGGLLVFMLPAALIFLDS